ncbi:MAG: phosphoribosylformylglycinamidine cyclo-ligase [SAR202 cluster bacterium]|nr:phosphoribosylformylglycinamidine cyclo-ligase [SAR202 cluster bacterium]
MASRSSPSAPGPSSHKKQPSPNGNTYKAAGVDREAASKVKRRIAALAASTHGARVIDNPGGFGGLYHLTGFKDPVLVSSTDSVGTKLRIAIWMESYRNLGMDVVNQNVNDVMVCGAKPLFFLDYIGMGKLNTAAVEEMVEGMAEACRESECALVGGETAELPGLYDPGDFDLAGFVVGAVERDAMLDTSKVRAGDALVALPSSGPHTNGYSLIRRIFGLDDDPSPLRRPVPELGATLGEALLAPHLPYYATVKPLLPYIKAMAHITGGGVFNNVPRSLPQGLGARIDLASWDVPPLFGLIQRAGKVERDEMFRVFNMGLGMVLVCAPENAARIVKMAGNAWVAGEVVKTDAAVRVALE